ncbi:SDR family oxidoreductase [Adhaeribacter sp. BT258]|uniref:SDR family oxidoreductase n=1 Tax=Adhaeribacter terrigena TaxID=2793070 RepID=A0ABS1C136_9BACT|nr:SDR family oxidoreductase [Adhaeribacter terrigena]MBK0403119.1 SDR family oxidoreductase [Adhaeribacter terrigena]
MTAKKISILGCGWLGLPLAEALVQQGYEVHGSTTTSEKLNLLAEKQIQPYLIDLNNPEKLPVNQAFFESKILIVNVPPKRNSGNNYTAQIQNLQSVLQHSKVTRIIFVSSTSVYKPSLEEITEESALDHENAKELIEAEKFIAASENPWQTTIIRFAGLFGPGRAPGRFLAGKTDLPDPETPVNLIHLQDCTQIIQEIIKQEKWNEVFNACADEHPGREVFYTEAARKLQLPLPTFEAKTVGKKPGKLISNQKLKTALHYDFLFPDPLKAL